MSDATEVTLRTIGAGAVIAGAVIFTVLGQFGAVWRSEAGVRSPYARSGRITIVWFWLAAVSVAWCASRQVTSWD